MYAVENKVALVTGSNAGLGKALANRFCKMGARVVLNGRDREKLLKCTSEFLNSGYEVTQVAGDISDPEDCQKIVDHCTKEFGRLDILVCNAGVSSGGAFIDTTPETFRKVFEINTLGTIYLTRYALPHITKTGGSIVFISSLAGLLGLPFSSLYSSSKMALTAVAQSLQVELKGTGVHVGIVYVGFLKNSPDKRVVGPNGELQPLGERKLFRLLPMDKASKIIIRFIQRRKRKMVISALGKALIPTLRFAPWIIWAILMNTQKKAQEIYAPCD